MSPTVLLRKAICSGLLLCAALLAAPFAWAQSVTFDPRLPTRSDDGCSATDAGPAQFDPCSGINYVACVNDVTFDFSLVIDDPNMASDHLAVLVGPSESSCIPAAGTTATPGCWPVTKPLPLSAAMNVTVRARDITAFLGSASPPTTYTPQNDLTTSCQAQTCPGPVKLGIYFLIEDAKNEVPADESPGEFLVHAGTLGPQAPVVANVVINDGYVTLAWQQPTETAIYGYNVYCYNYGRIDAALPGDEHAASPMETCDGAPGCTTVVDGGALSNECPSGPFGNVYTAPFCSGGATADSATKIEASTPVALETGTTVEEAGVVSTGPIDTNAGISEISAGYLCASPTDAIDGAMTTASAMGATVSAKNYDFYVFAVAAVDDLGNVGAIGNAQCGTPGPIKDFWFNYLNDGGLAGGGYCALEGVGMPAGSACMTVGVGLAAVGLVRRRRGRKTKR